MARGGAAAHVVGSMFRIKSRSSTMQSEMAVSVLPGVLGFDNDCSRNGEQQRRRVK